MKKPSIYPDRSQELLALFDQAGNNKKIMCIPIDYAKKDHLVMFCNGYGEVLRKPFSVNNSVDGVKYLLDQVSRSCRHRHIRPEHVFFGGEDVNSYAENFANTLRAKGWLVASILILMNVHDHSKIMNELIQDGHVITKEKAACLAPYHKVNINRLGAYFLDELREKLIIDFGLPVVYLSN